MLISPSQTRRCWFFWQVGIFLSTTTTTTTIFIYSWHLVHLLQIPQFHKFSFCDVIIFTSVYVTGICFLKTTNPKRKRSVPYESYFTNFTLSNCLTLSLQGSVFYSSMFIVWRPGRLQMFFVHHHAITNKDQKIQGCRNCNSDLWWNTGPGCHGYKTGILLIKRTRLNLVYMPWFDFIAGLISIFLWFCKW